MERRIRKLHKPGNLRIAITFLQWLHIKRFVLEMPFQIRFGMLHFLFTMGFLILYPPIDQLPFALVPITWCASLCVTVTIYPFLFPVRRRVEQR